jgi:hypothetical protein
MPKRRVSNIVSESSGACYHPDIERSQRFRDGGFLVLLFTMLFKNVIPGKGPQ